MEKPDQKVGLYEKFKVERLDGSTAPGKKHAGCRFFVLDLEHDAFAPMTIWHYAHLCAGEFPALAEDLRLLSQKYGNLQRERKAAAK
jgi:hypothetical protein